MLSLGNNDILNGKGGDDVLCGGEGNDLLFGNDGNDFLDGGVKDDVLNGGNGDHDDLRGGDGNDVLLDGDGVGGAKGGAGTDVLTLALRNGWRDGSGQRRFIGALAAGYGNDTVILAILDPGLFEINITGDEQDNPPSQFEGTKDWLGLLGNLFPPPVILKFEKQLVVSVADVTHITDETGYEYWVDEEEDGEEQTNEIFLPIVIR
jgi:hypothetical protein